MNINGNSLISTIIILIITISIINIPTSLYLSTKHSSLLITSS